MTPINNKGSGVLLVPVPEDEELFGIAKGASSDNYPSQDYPTLPSCG